MAKDHRRLAEEVAQGILLDNPSFLKEIVERVLQELLEAEMTEHVGPLPMRAHHRTPRASQRPQAPHPQDAGRHAEPAHSSG